jgi:tetratricopeptide (TPR) repeat protein
MAPEQAQATAAAIGPAADVYAVGAILYELLTGRPPFKAPTPLATVLQVLHEEPVPPHSLQPKLPRDLETICLTCLRKEPRRRYASALALVEDLRRFLAGEPIRARPIGPVERGLKWARRRPAVATLIGVSAVALVLLAAGVVWLHVALQAAKAERQRANDQAEQTVRALYMMVTQMRDDNLMLFNMGKHSEGLASITQAVERLEPFVHGEQNPELRRQLETTLHTFYGLRGLFYRALGRWREAQADFERLPADDWSGMAGTYRSFLAMTLAELGKHKEAATLAEALAQKTDLPGDIVYNLALTFAASIPAVRQDQTLAATAKDRLADRYANRAMALLYRARDAGWFDHAAEVQDLRGDLGERGLSVGCASTVAFLGSPLGQGPFLAEAAYGIGVTEDNPLRSRPAFQKLLAELEAKAAKAKP